MMWGKERTFDDKKIHLKLAEPSDGCEPYSNSIPLKHQHAYVVDGLSKCPLSNIIHNAQMEQASALFIVNNNDSPLEELALPSHIAGRNHSSQGSAYMSSSSLNRSERSLRPYSTLLISLKQICWLPSK